MKGIKFTLFKTTKDHFWSFVLVEMNGSATDVLIVVYNYSFTSLVNFSKLTK